eukprot:m.150657 g.150657  ORF g.150657 m.150657 type:complete len:376 (-) comp16316_c0_seq1:3072-4199(-)
MIVLNEDLVLEMANHGQRPPALGALAMHDSDDEESLHPDNVPDISLEVDLQDAHHYDSAAFPTVLQGQIRPFFAHKSSCYIGQYSGLDEVAGEIVTKPVVVKFWNSGDLEMDRSEACLEAQLLSEASHPNIIQLLGMMQWGNRLGVVTHLANHHLRTLDGLMLDVHTQRGSCHWTRGDVYDVLFGIAQGLAHIHDLDIVHRDVKPNNVLLLIDPETDRYVPAICDFGSAQHMSQLEERTTGGALFFSPPHAAEEDPRLDDTYRYALVVWCVFTCQWPFEEERGKLSELEFYHGLQMGLRPRVPEALSELMARFINGLWATEAFERMPPLGKLPPLREDSTGLLAPMRRVVASLDQQDFRQDRAFYPRDQTAQCMA